jgi:NTE family protein
MMRVVDRQQPTPFADFELGSLLPPNVAGFAKERHDDAAARRAAARRRRGAARPGLGDGPPAGAGRRLPAGADTGAGVERYLRTVLDHPDRSDEFRQLGVELYLTATDLHTGERVVFGVEGWDDVPISTAVRASTALPMVYTPVKVRDHELVDRGIVSTTNLDIAVKMGAKFIVVVNPLVPFVNDFKTKMRTLTGTRARHVSDMGFPQIGYQASRSSPTSACTRWRSTGRSATRASTSC